MHSIDPQCPAALAVQACLNFRQADLTLFAEQLDAEWNEEGHDEEYIDDTGADTGAALQPRAGDFRAGSITMRVARTEASRVFHIDEVWTAGHPINRSVADMRRLCLDPDMLKRVFPGMDVEHDSTSSSQHWGCSKRGPGVKGVNYSQYKAFFKANGIYPDFNPLWEFDGPYSWLRSDHLHQYLIGLSRTLGSKTIIEVFLSVQASEFIPLRHRITERIKNLRPGVNRAYAAKCFVLFADDWWERNKATKKKVGKPLRWAFTGQEAFDFFVQDLALILQDVNAGFLPSQDSRYEKSFREAAVIPSGATNDLIHALILASDYCHLTTAPYFSSDDLIHLRGLALQLMRYLWITFGICTPKWWILLSVAHERRMWGSHYNHNTNVFEAAHKLVKSTNTNQRADSDKQRLLHQVRVNLATSAAHSQRAHRESADRDSELMWDDRRESSLEYDQDEEDASQLSTQDSDARLARILLAGESHRSVRHCAFPHYSAVVLQSWCCRRLCKEFLRRRGHRSMVVLAWSDFEGAQHSSSHSQRSRRFLLQEFPAIRHLRACICLHFASHHLASWSDNRSALRMALRHIPSDPERLQIQSSFLSRFLTDDSSNGCHLQPYQIQFHGAMELAQSPTQDFGKRFTVSELNIRAVPFPSIGYGLKKQAISSDVAYWDAPLSFISNHGFLGTQATYPTSLDQFDPRLPHHWDLIRYATVLSFFSVIVKESNVHQTQSFAFVRVWHRFQPPATVATPVTQQQLVQDPVDRVESFKVIPIQRILGLVPLVQHPVYPTIPSCVGASHLALPDRERRLIDSAAWCQSVPIVAEADSSLHVHDGWRLRVVHNAEWRNCRTHMRGTCNIPPLPFPTPLPDDVAALVRADQQSPMG